MKTLWIVLIVALLAYLGCCVLLYYKQRSLLYFPTDKIDIENSTELVIDNGDIRLRLHQLNPENSSAIIYFGGNAETVGNNASQFITLFPEHTIYLVNYRGYGGSSGQPTEQGLFSDALAIYDHLQPQHSHISTIGRSLGSGVATFLAANRHIHKLALITPFDSIRQVAQSHYPVFPMGLLLRDQFDSLSRVADIEAPTLIVIAEHDRVVPPARGNALAAAFSPEQVAIETIPDTDHNTISVHPDYLPLLSRFFALKTP